MAKKHSAQCACDAVKFEFNADPTFVAVCHCLDWKKASGDEAACFFGVPEDDFTLISGEPKHFTTSPSLARALIDTFVPIAAPGCSPATWKASWEWSSSPSAA